MSHDTEIKTLEKQMRDLLANPAMDDVLHPEHGAVLNEYKLANQRLAVTKAAQTEARTVRVLGADFEHGERSARTDAAHKALELQKHPAYMDSGHALHKSVLLEMSDLMAIIHPEPPNKAA